MTTLGMILLQVLAPFYIPQASSVAFAYDAASSYAATASSASHQWAHTCTTTDTKGALIIGLSLGACESDVTTVTVVWGSGGSAQTATQISVSKNVSACLQTYMFKVMNPHVGTDNIYVTYGESHSLTGTAISYRGVSSVSAGTTGNSASGTATVTVSSAAGRTVVAVAVAGSSNSFSPGTGVTERAEARETVGNKPGVIATKAGAASVTLDMTLDAGSDDWAIIAAELIP